MSINFNELRELLGVIAGTDIAELTLKTEAFELTVRKGATVSAALPVTTITSAPTEISAIPVPPPSPSPSPTPTSPSEPTPPTPVDKKWLSITSPMVGTFYRAPAPGESPFVEVGDRIRSGQTVCIVEAMKLMNEIESEVAGQVMELAVANGEPVEYGQVLMWVNP